MNKYQRSSPLSSAAAYSRRLRFPAMNKYQLPPTPHHQLNFRWRNQRQIRRNRRRVHAAGQRRAFA